MKRIFKVLPVLAVLACVFLLAACDSKRTVSLQYPSSVTLTVVSADSGVTATADKNVLTATIDSKGKYNVTVNDDAGTEIHITLTWEDDIVSAEDDSEYTFAVVSK